jgi:MFS family permease
MQRCGVSGQSAERPAATSASSTSTRRAIVNALGLVQILAWGSSYYLPAVLAEPIGRDMNWPLAWVMGGLSLGLLAGSLVAPHVGATIERHGGRSVLAFSALAIGMGQAGLAIAPNYAVYVLAWLVMGIGMAAGLYDANFAVLGRLYGLNARSAITTITLYGGFASTVCWPLSAFLTAQTGWRGACLTYSAIEILGALPLYLLVLPRSAPRSPSCLTEASSVEAAIVERRSLALLILLAATLTLSAALSSLMSAHLLTLLQADGIPSSAAVALGALAGPSMVVARVIEMAIARHHHSIWTQFGSASFVAIGVSALWAKFPFTPAALVSYGAGLGLESIAVGTLPLSLFGAFGYAALIGRLATPSWFAQAAAPWIGAILFERAGAHGTLAVVAAVALINVILTIGVAWIVRTFSRRATGLRL